MVALAILLATDRGDLRFDEGSLPTSRPQAYAASGRHSLVGGLDGLYLRKGKGWERIDTSSIKQIAFDKTGIAWIRKGNGAVDKVDLVRDRHFHDVLFADARRPWISTMNVAEGNLLFGGHGGWIEAGPKGNFVDHYPPELKGQVVTAIARQGRYLWVGTQSSGLWGFGAGKPLHLGLAAGLEDPWITGLVMHGAEGWIGTASDGLYKFSKPKLVKIACPFSRVRSLARRGTSLVVAADIGAFILETGKWRQLSKGEAYAAIPGKPVAILAPNEIAFRS